jgi:hypothetical protein
MNNIVKEPPQILRVKRKRTDDPLQALVMETSRRKIKRPRYVFRLKRTEENDIQDSTTVLTASDNRQNDKPVFNIPASAARKSISYGDGNFAAKFVQSSSTSETTTNTSTTATTTTSSAVVPDQAQVADSAAEVQPMELNPSLLEMLNDYLKNNDETAAVNNSVKPPKRRQSSVSQNGDVDREFLNKNHLNLGAAAMMASESAIEEEDEDDTEYVYDVYYRDKAVSEQWDTEHIGYIKFDDDDVNKLDGEDDDDMLMNTDDEDSNDENFYRNDYPEDEDAGYEDEDMESELESIGIGEPSDDQDDEFEILNDKRRFTRSDFLRSEGLKGLTEEDYRALASHIDEKPSFWKGEGDVADAIADQEDQLEDDIDEDDMDDTEYREDDESMNEVTSMTGSDVGLQRNIFFKSDRDDPMAIHRDRIFGKLQHMIDRSG